MTSVTLIEKGELTLQVMGIHGFQKALGDNLATLLLATAHLAPICLLVFNRPFWTKPPAQVDDRDHIGTRDGSRT